MAEGTKFMGCCDLVTVQVVTSHQVNMCDIKEYVAAIYNGAWWVAWVTGTYPEMQEVTLSFLHQCVQEKGHNNISTTEDL